MFALCYYCRYYDMLKENCIACNHDLICSRNHRRIPLLACLRESGDESTFVSSLGPSKQFVVHVYWYFDEGRMQRNRHRRLSLPMLEKISKINAASIHAHI